MAAAEDAAVYMLCALALVVLAIAATGKVCFVRRGILDIHLEPRSRFDSIRWLVRQSSHQSA